MPNNCSTQKNRKMPSTRLKSPPSILNINLVNDILVSSPKMGKFQSEMKNKIGLQSPSTKIKIK